MLRAFLTTTAVAAALGSAVFAQTRDRNDPSSRDCDNDWGRRAGYCDVREQTLNGANPLDVDTGGNGGISIRGWDRPEVFMRARIMAHADTEAEARRIATSVRIDTAGGTIRADGPRGDRDSNWSVNIELQVPRNAILTLNTKNGGISIRDFRGQAKLETTNGGVSLSDVNGDIRGTTRNGGLSVNLTGDHWDGQGLDVETHNGGIKMTVPDNYSAALETSTINGRINVDFPVTVRGRIGRELNTTLGSGGAKIRVVTTNGGVTISRR
jgi:DUF4097 and DUF4098 domain-containing protein YvlB